MISTLGDKPSGVFVKPEPVKNAVTFAGAPTQKTSNAPFFSLQPNFVLHNAVLRSFESDSRRVDVVRSHEFNNVNTRFTRDSFILCVFHVVERQFFVFFFV